MGTVARIAIRAGNPTPQSLVRVPMITQWLSFSDRSPLTVPTVFLALGIGCLSAVLVMALV